MDRGLLRRRWSDHRRRITERLDCGGHLCDSHCRGIIRHHGATVLVCHLSPGDALEPRQNFPHSEYAATACHPFTVFMVRTDATFARLWGQPVSVSPIAQLIPGGGITLTRRIPMPC